MSLARRVRWPLVGAAALVIAVVRKRRSIGLPRAASTGLAASAPLALALALPRGRLRAAVVWAAHMWAYKAAFEIPYDCPARLGARLRVEPPVRFDARIAGGTPPSERLQRRLRARGRVNWIDRSLTAVYGLWEAEPHVVLAILLFRRPDRFPVLATRQAATFDLTLLGYWLLPQAPPWWASEKAGLMGGAVQRVTTRVVRDLRNEALEQEDVDGANPWAAMPSDHFASALAAGFTLRELSPVAGAAGFAYALLLGFALVYLGEHYVADLAAGGALALGVAAADGLWASLANRLEEMTCRFEPSAT